MTPGGFRRGGVYVVAGGHGGLGRGLSLELARRYGARVAWLGRRAEVLASWAYVKGFQREDGLLPFAILPDLAGKTIMAEGKYPLTAAANGAVFVHWVPGNPLRTLANVTFLTLADAIYAQTVDRAWLVAQAPWLRRAAEWLCGQITSDGLMPGGGFYVERPVRLEYDGVNQCCSVQALTLAARLFDIAGDAATAARCRAGAATLTATFRTRFWAGDHCVEYLHPARGPISHHGLTDVDWAAVATGVASDAQTVVLWPQLRDNDDFLYSGMPSGIATRPETYEDWEMQGIDRHDLAAMGRVWYLECQARARLGDQAGIVRSLRRVAAVGAAEDWSWRERYYSARTGDLAKYHISHYCEYPANLIRIVHRFPCPT